MNNVKRMNFSPKSYFTIKFYNNGRGKGIVGLKKKESVFIMYVSCLR